MSLSSFPPELLFLICEYAWNSDGGRHLSLVSKLFRDITVPLQYRCVSMTTTNRSIALIIPKDLPAFHRVRHLFVSHAPPSATAWMDALKEVADALKRSRADVNGFYPFPARNVDMPQLRRLHLAGHRNPQGLLEQWRDVLRISGATGAYMFAKEVQDVLLRRDDEDDGAGVLESLKLLMIQLGPEIPTKKRADEQMLEVLRGVAQQKRVDGPRLVLVEDRLEGSKLDSKQTMAIWRDGIDGLDSWWQ
ncbi:hypothetical protein CPB85DRAFT_1293447 [Mucidula mucida]|nr:hypothetical protein CPB85DRAFT_1293447 [Mucidula mucida]